MSNCRRSCQSCQGGDRAWKLRSELAKNYDNSSSQSNATRIVRIESVRIQHMEIVQIINLFWHKFMLNIFKRMKPKNRHEFLADLSSHGMIQK